MKKIILILFLITCFNKGNSQDLDNSINFGFNVGYEVVTGEQDVATWDNGIGLGFKIRYQFHNSFDLGINIGYKSWNPVIRDAPFVYYYEAFPLTMDLRYYFDTFADYNPFFQIEGGFARFKTITDMLISTTNRRNVYNRTRSYQTVTNYSLGAGMRTPFLSDIDFEIVAKYNALLIDRSDFNYVTIELVALYNL